MKNFPAVIYESTYCFVIFSAHPSVSKRWLLSAAFGLRPSLEPWFKEVEFELYCSGSLAYIVLPKGSVAVAIARIRASV